METIKIPEESAPSFDEYRKQYYQAHDENEKRNILARMEKAAMTAEELKVVDNYVLPDTSMKRIIANRIAALEKAENQTDQKSAA